MPNRNRGWIALVKVPLVVAGHSHVAALDQPAPEIGLVDIDETGVSILQGPWPRDVDYWSAFEQAARDRMPAIVWEGDQHNAAFLIEPTPPLDFVLSSAPDLPMDPRASYVAESQLRALFAPGIDPLGPIIRRMTQVSGGAVLIAGTPPPMGDADAIRARLANDPRVAAIAKERGSDVAAIAITSPYTMQKLWSLIQSMLAETAMAANGVFVPVPDRVRGDDGFLLERYWSDSATHANEDYRREMLNELAGAAEALAGELEADAA